MHKEAKSDEFLDVGETFWRVCPPQRTKRTFWIRQCPLPEQFRRGRPPRFENEVA